jgi:hypothetical protein
MLRDFDRRIGLGNFLNTLQGVKTNSMPDQHSLPLRSENDRHIEFS